MEVTRHLPFTSLLLTVLAYDILAAAVPAALPDECEQAVNLTQAWRNADTSTKWFKPNTTGGLNGYNCDSKAMIDAGRPWFRMAGEAGNRVTDACQKPGNCGTTGSLWTDASIPDDLFEIKEITFYMSWVSCYYGRRAGRVMRCGENDIIYQYTDVSDLCNAGFCGVFK